jgi:tRNA G18 (ribose-2'-O)-methylase SpoU
MINQINEDLIANYNVLDGYKFLSLEEVKEIQQKDSLPFAVCGFNIAGSLNIGMMIRTALLMGAEKFIVFGRRAYDRRSCVGAQNYLPIERIEGYDEDGNFSKTKFDQAMDTLGYMPVFIETGGIDIRNLDYIKTFNKKPCLVFGTESEGIPENIIGDGIKMSIPQLGVLRSLNVASAASIAMWEFSKFYRNI